MKKLLPLLLFLIPFCSCNKESAALPVEDSTDFQFTNDFSIIEESEISSEELFDLSVKSLEPFGNVEGVSELKNSFAEAQNRMEPSDGTKSCLSKLRYKTVRICYTTKDQSDEEVKVSALIVYPLLRKMDKVLLINHGTTAGVFMVPTNYTSIEAVMAATGALCILPDYIGLGESSDHGELYLNAEVSGRTSTDALQTLLSYARKKGLLLSKSFDTYVVGYSQGGAVSLASLRQIQTLSKSAQKALRLKKVICGDGPYDLKATFDCYLEDYQAGERIGLGAVVPRVINGMFNSYPDEFSEYEYEDFFTSWALWTGVPQAIRDNDATVCDMLVKFAGAKLSDILDMDYIESQPEAYNMLIEAMQRQNLCTGWTPVYPLQLFHCNPDGIVPYRNFENAYDGLRCSSLLEPDIVNFSYLEDPLVQHITGMAVMIGNVLSGKYFQ